jgi:hypothetical protein
LLLCPVVCVVEAGGAVALGSELWSGAVGRVAVVGGVVVLLWANAAAAVKRKALDSSETASALGMLVIDLLLSDR